MYRAIFHIDEMSKANLALNNVRNLIEDLGEDHVEIELLANSEGIRLLTKASNPYGNPIRRLASSKVIFAACANSMNFMNLKKGDLVDGCVVVPSGVGELVKKQSEGWAYIKP